MCGIVGLYKGNISSNELQEMSNRLIHRGPDDSGVYVCQTGLLGFAHRRLAIQDPGAMGSQPMLSKSGRFVIVFNGEIYNHQELRTKLLIENPNLKWSGHSDTETLLEVISYWGLERALREIVGMFALAVWDNLERQLFLARDRMGEKPLYYGFFDEQFIFSSELKGFPTRCKKNFKLSSEGLRAYLKYGYVPEPYSIYSGVNKLMPGCYIKISKNDRSFQIYPYWDYASAVKRSQSSLISIPTDNLVSQLDNKLAEVVSKQQIADVEIGCLLSGGIDSSLIAAMMQNNSSDSINTYTIGFKDKAYDESRYAKKVADYLGTKHHELILGEKEIISVIEKIPMVYDEPFADASQIPTFLVSAFASKKVKVVLTGDGGDELFGGYNRYIWAKKLSQLCDYEKWIFRKLLMGFSNKYISSIMLNGLSMQKHKQRAFKLESILNLNNIADIYDSLVTIWSEADLLLLESMHNLPLKKNSFIRSFDSFESLLTDQCKMMAIDSLSYLPGDILCKVDRATMANSLEARAPFLDPELVQFAWRIDPKLKIRNNSSKWILKEVLKKYLPEKIVERPKMGFGIPLGNLLRGPLREWAQNLLSESRIKQDGLFNYEVIHKTWDEHLKGIANWENKIWTILMFQAWFDNQERA
jgi:asparagine synthase (glutamine-hydrolysing)